MVKKVFTDGEAELTVNHTEDYKFIITVEDSDKDSFHFCSVSLDEYDVEELINDLQYYLNELRVEKSTNGRILREAVYDPNHTVEISDEELKDYISGKKQF